MVPSARSWIDRHRIASFPAITCGTERLSIHEMPDPSVIGVHEAESRPIDSKGTQRTGRERQG
jgi:hypothetical protein